MATELEERHVAVSGLAKMRAKLTDDVAVRGIAVLEHLDRQGGWVTGRAQMRVEMIHVIETACQLRDVAIVVDADQQRIQHGHDA